jgi:ribosomal protein S18 acetylase RimI-like enzyme
VQVRAALPADVDAVVALVESAYRGEPSRAGWTTEADLLAGRRTGPDEVLPLVPSLLLAEDDGELVACCALVEHDDHAYFGMFAVRPGLQGSGIGSALLGAAEEQARQQGLARVEMTVLTARTELIAWYLRRGYAHTGERRPFPYGDPRFGDPQRTDLEFTVLAKTL